MGDLSMAMLVYQRVNVPIQKNHPNIGDIIFNRYFKVMFKIPKVGHLPSPGKYGHNDITILITTIIIIMIIIDSHIANYEY